MVDILGFEEKIRTQTSGRRRRKGYAEDAKKSEEKNTKVSES
jgi:hypothetical protein